MEDTIVRGNGNRTGKTVRRLLLAGIFLGLVIFLFTRGSGSGSRASYTDGVNGLKLAGETYELVCDITEQEYVGSKVSAAVRAVHGERTASVKSFGIFTIAALYKVEGDTAGNYLVDSAERIYAKSSIAAEAKRMLGSDDSFSEIRITDETRNISGMQKLTEEQTAAVANVTGEETVVTDKGIVSDYGNRRELIGFTEDGIFRKVLGELFLYNGEVYLTTGFEGDRDVRKDQVLRGIKLSAEAQVLFRGFWPGNP